MRLVYARRRSGKCAMHVDKKKVCDAWMMDHPAGRAVSCRAVRTSVRVARVHVARECAAAFRGHACDDLLGGARGRDATPCPPAWHWISRTLVSVMSTPVPNSFCLRSPASTPADRSPELPVPVNPHACTCTYLSEKRKG